MQESSVKQKSAMNLICAVMLIVSASMIKKMIEIDLLKR